MTNGTSQGLFIVIAIIIFGIFVGLSQTVFGKTLTNGLVDLFTDATEQSGFRPDEDYNDEDAIPSEEGDFIFDGVNKIIGYRGTDTEIVIPDEIDGKAVTAISGDAFNNKGLTKVIMPNTLSVIDDGRVEGEDVIGAFANNDIQEISFSANMQYIGSFAFFSGRLDEMTLPEGLKSIGESAFEKNELTNVTIPSTVENIGDEAFKENKLEKVEYTESESVVEKQIGNDVFADNNLKELEIPAGTKEIKENAYSNLGLEKLVLPAGLETIGKDAFKENNLTDVVIPESVKTIEDGAFKENDLTNISRPSGLEHIGEYAFYKNLLPVVHLPDSLLTIGKYAFYSNKLVDVEIPSKLNAIREWTFAYNQMPKKPTIPANIKLEEEYAFFGNLFEETKQSDYYGGKDVVVSDDKLFVFNENTGTITDYIGTQKDIVIPYEINGVTVKHIGPYAFNMFDSLGSPPNAIDVDLTSIVLPDTVETIGKAGFQGESATMVNTTLTLGDGLIDIGDSAFAYLEISNVVIPDSVKTIGDSAFRGTDSNPTLEFLTLGNSVETIGTGAFSSNKIIELVIPDSVITIGDAAFSNFRGSTRRIIKLTLGNSVEHIGNQAFHTASFPEVVIPESVKTIGDQAFYKAILADGTVTIHNTKENVTIGTDAFYYPNRPLPTITYTK